ncbi:MAG: hypothetical protein GY739_14330 [Mesoflavibacter sp.]|nr:hypothetical protein [Mesoflavibacter sp.]
MAAHAFHWYLDGLSLFSHTFVPFGESFTFVRISGAGFFLFGGALKVAKAFPGGPLLPWYPKKNIIFFCVIFAQKHLGMGPGSNFGQKKMIFFHFFNFFWGFSAFYALLGSR